jgi:cytochrome c5
MENLTSKISVTAFFVAMVSIVGCDLVGTAAESTSVPATEAPLMENPEIQIAAFTSEPLGAQYYAQFCGFCHGDDASGGVVGEGVRGESADDIWEEIDEVQDMWWLSFLTVDQVDEIAAYLKTLDDGDSDSEDHGSEDGDSHDDD